MAAGDVATGDLEGQVESECACNDAGSERGAGLVPGGDGNADPHVAAGALSSQAMASGVLQVAQSMLESVTNEVAEMAEMSGIAEHDGEAFDHGCGQCHAYRG